MLDEEIETRIHDRKRLFEPIYQLIDGVEHEIGFVFNFSHSGVNLLIKEKELDKINEDFTFIFYTPEDFNIKSIEFSVHLEWKSDLKKGTFEEVGCSFKDLSKQTKDQLQQLLSYYEIQSEYEE